MSRLRVSCVLALLAACSTGSEDPGDSGGTDSEEIGLIGEGIAWQDKSLEEKFSWMTFRVLPEMRVAFEAFDPAYADTFACSTCHGTETTTEGYGVMPHPTGPASLSFSNWPGDSTDPVIQDYVAFMEDEVTPKMAELLDTVVSNQGGVNCGTCHVLTN